MKKFLVVMLIILCLAGIGFLGYTVFRSKNIEKVEIDGQIQTLYLVNEATTPDFQDAKLKVTYKNGTTKSVDLNSKSVKINDFSTSIETRETYGVMKITYKSETIKVPYSVIRSGMYYRYYEEHKTTEKTTSYTLPSISNVEFMFSIENGGKVKAYNKNGTDWILIDGKYNPEYNYSLSNDTLVVKLGTKVFNIKTTYKNGEMEILSTSSTYKNGIEETKDTYKFRNIQGAVNDNITIKSAKIANKGSVSEMDGTNPVFRFNRFSNIESSRNIIFLEIGYGTEYIINVDGIKLINKVYMQVTDEMVPRLSHEISATYTSSIRTTVFRIDGYNKDIVLYYKVNQA